MSVELRELWGLVIILVFLFLLTCIYLLFAISDLKHRLSDLEEFEDKHQWSLRPSGMPEPSEHLTRPWARKR